MLRTSGSKKSPSSLIHDHRTPRHLAEQELDAPHERRDVPLASRLFAVGIGPRGEISEGKRGRGRRKNRKKPRGFARTATAVGLSWVLTQMRESAELDR